MLEQVQFIDKVENQGISEGSLSNVDKDVIDVDSLLLGFLVNQVVFIAKVKSISWWVEKSPWDESYAEHKPECKDYHLNLWVQFDSISVEDEKWSQSTESNEIDNA